MTIQQCKYVLEIAKTGSFNQASKRLFVAQSSLSISVKALEKELNIKIFERNKNGILITTEGAEFLKYARQLCEHNDFIESRYKSENDCKKLNIVTQHYDFVADVFCSMLREIDDTCYHFSLRETKTYDVIKEIENFTCDLGIIAIKDNDFDLMIRYLTNKKITFECILTALPHVYIRNNHPLSNYERITQNDLASYPYLSYEQGSHNSSFFTEELYEVAGANKHVEISDRATLMNVLLTTDCFTIGTGIMPSALNDDKIKSVPYDSDVCYRIGYIVSKEKKDSTLVESFLSRLKEFAKSL